MNHYYQKSGITLYNTDCREVAKFVKCDFIITDPPYPDYHKDKHLRGVYGITLEQYNSILEFQEYRCCVCGKHESEVPRKRLYVDHCHKSGDIRGLICAHCNTALGMVKDDVEILYRLAAYLNEFQ